MKINIYFIPLLFALFFCSTIMAQKPNPAKGFEISLKADEKIETVYKNNQRINSTTGIPVAIYGLAVPVEGSSPEDMAWNYLLKDGKALGLHENNLSQLKHHGTRSTNAGTVVRYRQYYQDVPVNKGEITISISPENKVVYVANSFSYGVEKKISTVTPTLSLASARSAAEGYLPDNKNSNYLDTRLMIYQNKHVTRLTYEVIISSQGEWHVFVDAQTGEIFKVEDQAHYYCKHNDKKHDHSTCNASADKGTATTMVDGTGLVFNPDPLSSNQVAYGGGYSDNNDANSPQLEASLFSVTLNDIEFANGVYTLRGPYAEIVDFEPPSTGLFQQDSSEFNYNRFDQAFEPVNTYYHIDYLMRYINETLECNVLPYQYSGGVQYDPHGVGGQDNSYYSPQEGHLSFGEGCVDDAEDSDVIHHELGHGLHDWVTLGGLSQEDGLSEGCGDYVAQSYNRSLNNWGTGNSAYNWMFNWDGHNECWDGRITNYSAVYPGGLVGQIHTDGQIWASCLMDIWDEIGQQRMDKIFYEGLGMTNSSSNQNDAANAVYIAASNLNYTQAELTAIYNGLTDCGYILPFIPTEPDDARLAAIMSPEGQYCDSLIQPVITLSNYGTNELTSVDIIYDIDGMNPITENWTGMLASGASVDYTLNEIAVDAGSHTFNIRTENPNGNMDTNVNNDAASSGFTVTLGGETVNLELLTDDYGYETSWELTDENGNVLFEDGDYPNTTIINETWCLDNGCYTWTIFDEFGDGICCNFGQGGYQILADDGSVVGSGGQFGSSASIDFCVPIAGGSDAVANFNVSSSSICIGESVTITNNSANAESYSWSAPGAMPDMSTDENPTFNFPQAGTYTISLTVTNAEGSSSTDEEIVVHDLPVVSEITGEAEPVNGSTESYTTPLNTGSTYSWAVTGGTQVSGGNTNTIEVMWMDTDNMAFVCVTETDANGCQSEEYCYDVLTVVSVEDIALIKGLNIFPNPTDGMLYIESNETPDNIEIFDIIGQRIDVGYQNNTINMSQQAAGIYLLRVTYEEGSTTKRIVVE